MKLCKPTTAGCLCAVLLSASLSGQELLYEFTGEADGDLFGSGLALLDDIDGDGRDDLFMGAPFYGSRNQGRAYVYSGRTGQILYLLEGQIDQYQGGDRLGGSGSAAGDVDQDGFNDFMLGFPNGGIVDEGVVNVYSGSTGTVLRQYFGVNNSDSFGVPIQRITDIDGDGFGDLLISATGWAPWGGDDSKGKVYVYSGLTGAFLRDWKGEKEFDRFGSRLANVGDIDGDRVSDFAISAPLNFGYDDERGKVYVYSGRTLELIYAREGTKPFDKLMAAAGLGDLNDDGYGELLAGAPASIGYAYIYSGPDGKLMHTIYGQGQQYDNFGFSVASTGDVNGDGTDDFLVGERYRASTSSLGRAYLYSGKNFRLLYSFTGTEPYQWLSLALSSAGDINRDGLADFMASGPYSATGSVYVYSGNDLFLQAEESRIYEGDTLRLFTRGGTPFAWMTLALVEISGSSTYQPLVTSRLDRYGEHTFEMVIPPGMSGLVLKFQSFAEKPSRSGDRGTLRGGTADSACERVNIL